MGLILGLELGLELGLGVVWRSIWVDNLWCSREWNLSKWIVNNRCWCLREMFGARRRRQNWNRDVFFLHGWAFERSEIESSLGRDGRTSGFG